MPSNTKENGFETLIVDTLVNSNGYEQGVTTEYHKQYAIDEDRLFRFLLSTQKKAMDELHILDSDLEKDRFFKQLDKKLGQLLWLSREMLQRQMEHEVLCLTGDGPVRFTVTDNATWEQGLRAILRSRPAKTDDGAENENKLWQYHIGGDGNDT